MAVIAAGLISNFLVVLFFSIRSVIRKEKSLGITKLFNKKILTEVKSQYPNLNLDTTIFVICLVLPFVVFLIVFIGHLRKINLHK
jgi:hypothetical protein